MSDIFHCGDHEALVSYLYDEGDPAQRDAIAAHVAMCAMCADEIVTLRSTRTLLAGWTPPDAALGFRITGAAERGEPVVLRPAAWWRQPLPAWAQAAAAALIFAAGLAVGSAGGPAGGEAVATAPAPASSIAPAGPAAVPVVSREDLATLDERLRAIEAAQARNVSMRPAAATDEALLRRVEALIGERLEESEDRQRRESIRLIADAAGELDARQLDLEQRVAGIAQASKVQTVTVHELKQQQDQFNALLPQVSFRAVSTRR